MCALVRCWVSFPGSGEIQATHPGERCVLVCVVLTVCMHVCIHLQGVRVCDCVCALLVVLSGRGKVSTMYGLDCALHRVGVAHSSVRWFTPTTLHPPPPLVPPCVSPDPLHFTAPSCVGFVHCPPFPLPSTASSASLSCHCHPIVLDAAPCPCSPFPFTSSRPLHLSHFTAATVPLTSLSCHCV
jgi:hypothetical protein